MSQACWSVGMVVGGPGCSDNPNHNAMRLLDQAVVCGWCCVTTARHLRRQCGVRAAACAPAACVCACASTPLWPAHAQPVLLWLCPPTAVWSRPNSNRAACNRPGPVIAQRCVPRRRVLVHTGAALSLHPAPRAASLAAGDRQDEAPPASMRHAPPACSVTAARAAAAVCVQQHHAL